MTVVGTLEAELKADPAIWEAAMKRATESMEGLARKVELSSQKIKASNKAAEEAASSLQRLQDSAKSVGEQVSKIGAVTSGMGAAFSSAVPQMQGAVGAAAGLAQAFASGGPLLAGIALAGTVLGAVVSKLSSMKEEADKASAALAKVANESADAATRALADATRQEQRLRLLRRQAAAAPEQREAIAADEAARILEADVGKKRAEIADLRRQQAEIESRGQRKVTYAEDAKAAAQGLLVAVELGETDRENLNTVNKRLHDEQLILSTLEGQVDAIREEARLRADIARSGKDKSAAGDEQKASSARTIAELTPMQTQAMNQGDFALLEYLLGDFGTNLEQASGGSLEFARELLRMAEASSDTAARLKDAEKAAKELAEEQDKATKKAREDAAQKLGGQYADAIGAVGSGTVGSLAMTAGLGAAGAAASIAIGDPTGLIGGQIGQVIGQVLGPIADEIMAQLGTFGPLMDSLRTVVSGLLPVFGFLGAVVGIVANVLDMLAPIVLAVSEVAAAISVPFLRIAETILPIFMLQFTLLMPIIDLVADALVLLVNVLDTYVLLPIAKAVAWLYNAIAGFVNGLIGWVNNLGILGIHLEEMAEARTPESMLEMGIINQELIRATDDNTEQLEEFNRSMTNLPTGYRYALTEYRSESANGFGGGGVGRRDMSGRGGGLVINGPVNVMARDSNILEEIRRTMRERGVPFGGPVASTPPKRN